MEVFWLRLFYGIAFLVSQIICGPDEHDVCETSLQYEFGSATEADRASGLAFDSTGQHLYLAGATSGAMFDDDVGGMDPIMAKLTIENNEVVGIAWGWQPRTPADDEALALCPAEEGEDAVYVAGWAGTDNDAWVAKIVHDADQTYGGSKEWGVSYGNSGEDMAVGINIDDSGDLLVCGHTNSDTFGTHEGKADAWAAKLDASDGSIIWSTQFGTASDDLAMGCTIDENGDIYVVGYTEGNLESTNAGGDDLFVAKLAGADGARRWALQAGTAEDDRAVAVVYDEENAALNVVGLTRGALYGDNADGGHDLWALRLGAAGGAVRSSFQLGAPGGNLGLRRGTKLALDAGGDLVVAGYSAGPGAFAASLGEPDIWVAKISWGNSGGGKLEWVWQMEGSGLESYPLVGINADQELFLALRATGEGSRSAAAYDLVVSRLVCPGNGAVVGEVRSSTAMKILIGLMAATGLVLVCACTVWCRGHSNSQARAKHLLLRMQSSAFATAPSRMLSRAISGVSAPFSKRSHKVNVIDSQLSDVSAGFFNSPQHISPVPGCGTPAPPVSGGPQKAYSASGGRDERRSSLGPLPSIVTKKAEGAEDFFFEDRGRLASKGNRPASDEEEGTRDQLTRRPSQRSRMTPKSLAGRLTPKFKTSSPANQKYLQAPQQEGGDVQDQKSQDFI